MKINICEFKGEIAKRGKKNPTELLLFYAIHATPFISMCLGTYSFIKLINLNSFFFFSFFLIHVIPGSRCHCLPFL